VRFRLPQPTSRRLVLLAGAALVAVGIICLYLSNAVARTGSWWQGTLDAFGVGFVVGGIVDVTAISLLNQILTGSTGQQWRDLNRRAERLLDEYPRMAASDGLGTYSTYVNDFIDRYADTIDPLLRVRLEGLRERMDSVQADLFALDPWRYQPPDRSGHAGASDTKSASSADFPAKPEPDS
jgi:hypothetical protein